MTFPFPHDSGGDGAGTGNSAFVGSAVIYTGTGSSQAVSGVGFSPDLVAVKARGATTDWRWVDNVRGVGLSLTSDGTAAEATEATGLTAFGANGFTVGADTDYNDNAVNYLALCFQEVADAFDIVAYTGTGSSGLTVNHNLGVVPELMIVKNRTSLGTNWAVYPGPLSSPGTKFLQFHTTAAVGTAASVWNNTAPTSSLFTLGNSSAVNGNGNNHIAWLFASKTGISSVGSYTGNTGTPPTITTGFTPRFVIIKRTDSTGNWVVFDNARDASTPHSIYSFVNTTAAEATSAGGGGIDFQATGFQPSGTDSASINVNTATYIYLALR